tara:strand:+ start:1566 stop:2414 length:849 start_codon:yes stop_codon:yes gene_type:complete
MIKVVDSNCLQDACLEKFLSNPRNRVAISDQVAIEAYKGDPLKGIYKSYEIVSKHPKQVLILKRTRIACGLSPKSKGLRARFIDNSQTKSFSKFCKDLRLAQRGDKKIEKEILEHGSAANRFMDEAKDNAKNMKEEVEKIFAGFSKDDKRKLREGRPYPENIKNKIITDILIITRKAFELHSNFNGFINPPLVHNYYIFRYAVSSYFLALRWMLTGGINDARLDRLRNDAIDMQIISFSTYFDGILTNDNKAIEVLNDVNWFIGMAKISEHEGHEQEGQIPS